MQVNRVRFEERGSALKKRSQREPSSYLTANSLSVFIDEYLGKHSKASVIFILTSTFLLLQIRNVSVLSQMHFPLPFCHSYISFTQKAISLASKASSTTIISLCGFRVWTKTFFARSLSLVQSKDMILTWEIKFDTFRGCHKRRVLFIRFCTLFWKRDIFSWNTQPMQLMFLAGSSDRHGAIKQSSSVRLAILRKWSPDRNGHFIICLE